ncbi:MAG: hypothetical protein JWQ95_5499 [Sphaerisporangium sp.]|nr:hypothetical protein [Sphaerisporangium sp.]
MDFAEYRFTGKRFWAKYISDDQDDICHAAHEHTTVRWVAAMVRHRADEAWASRKRYEAEYDAFAGDDSVILTWRGPADVHAPEAAERAGHGEMSSCSGFTPSASMVNVRWPTNGSWILSSREGL